MVTLVQPKIDYYTSIWHNSSMREILSFLDIEEKCAEFVEHAYMAVRGIENNFNFRYNDIELSVPVSEFYLFYNDPNEIDSKVVDHVFKRIRLNLSGSALDYLRSLGFDVNFRLREMNLYDVRPYHITRCDIAFDFVNYSDTFMTELCNYLFSFQLKGVDRIRFMRPEGRGYSLKYSLKLGGQRTVYLGAPTADRLLRIYDKKMEFDSSGKTDSELPFELDSDGLVSWFRIELQLRNKEAEAMFFSVTPPGEDYFLAVLRWIYDNYMFRRMDIRVEYQAQICPWWERLWDWELIPELITQNTNSVHYISSADKILDRIERSGIFFLQLYDAIGLRGFIDLLKSNLSRLQTEDDNKELDFKRRIRLKMFIDRRNEYCDDERFGMFIKRLPNGHFDLGISEDKLDKIIEILESD